MGKLLSNSILDLAQCPLFSNTETQLLFALRSHCVRGIKANFSSHYKNNLSCALLCGNKTQIDDQQHLLQCVLILVKLSSSDLKTLNNVKITDIYGTVQQQKSVVSIITRLLEIRNNILESQQLFSVVTPASGTSLDTAPLVYQGSDGDNY